MEGVLRHLRRDIFVVFIVVLPKDVNDEFSHLSKPTPTPSSIYRITCVVEKKDSDDDLDVLVFPKFLWIL